MYVCMYVCTVVQSGHLFPKPSHNTTVLKCCVVGNFSQHYNLKLLCCDLVWEKVAAVYHGARRWKKFDEMFSRFDIDRTDERLNGEVLIKQAAMPYVVTAMLCSAFLNNRNKW